MGTPPLVYRKFKASLNPIPKDKTKNTSNNRESGEDRKTEQVQIV